VIQPRPTPNGRGRDDLARLATASPRFQLSAHALRPHVPFFASRQRGRQLYFSCLRVWAKYSTVTRIRIAFSTFLSRSSPPEATVKWVSFGQRNRPFRIPMQQQNHPRYIVSVEKEVPGDHLLDFFPFARMLTHQLSLLQLFLVASVPFAQNWKADSFAAIPLAVIIPYLQTWSRRGTAEGSWNSGWESFRDKSVWILLEPLQWFPHADWWRPISIQSSIDIPFERLLMTAWYSIATRGRTAWSGMMMIGITTTRRCTSIRTNMTHNFYRNSHCRYTHPPTPTYAPPPLYPAEFVFTNEASKQLLRPVLMSAQPRTKPTPTRADERRGIHQ